MHLEKAAAQLARFRDLARSSLESRGLKRAKETCGEVGVSPGTVRVRPHSKVARKKLTFTGLPDSPVSGAAANVTQRGGGGDDSEGGFQELGSVSGSEVEPAVVPEISLGEEFCRPDLPSTSGDCNNIII